MADTLKETFQVSGDAPDPAGTGMRGVSPGYDFTKSAIGHPMLHYALPNGKELIVEADVYHIPGEAPYVLLECPICMMAKGGKTGTSLKISADNKKLSYEKDGRVPPFPGWSEKQMKHCFPSGAGGLLSVEEFACSWEVEPELRRHFGFAVCPWRVVIENNVIKDV